MSDCIKLEMTEIGKISDILHKVHLEFLQIFVKNDIHSPGLKGVIQED